MGRMEEYYLWKKGELNKKMSKETLDFFKTEPTNEQLIALEAYDKRMLWVVIFTMVSFFAIGIMYGFTGGIIYS